MITNEQAALLSRPFSVEEHSFRKGAGWYIEKSAIRRRLHQVDPRWSISAPELITHDGDVVVMRGALTLLGVTRADIGTGIVQHAAPDKDTGEINPITEALFLAKAYKSAAADLLPRCALKFGIGSYLKSIPKDVNRSDNPGALRKWLDSFQPAQPAAPAAPPPAESVMTRFGAQRAEPRPALTEMDVPGMGTVRIGDAVVIVNHPKLAGQPGTVQTIGSTFVTIAAGKSTASFSPHDLASSVRRANAPQPDIHWVFAGGGDRLLARAEELNITKAALLNGLQPGTRIERLSDCTLTEAEAMARLDVLAQEMKDKAAAATFVGVTPSRPFSSAEAPTGK